MKKRLIANRINLLLLLCLVLITGTAQSQINACPSLAGETISGGAEFGNSAYGVNGDLTVAAMGGEVVTDPNTADWYFGTAANVDVYGAVTVNAGALVWLSSGAVLNIYGDFVNNGILVVQSGATINFYGQTWTNNSSTAQVLDGAAVANTIPGGAINFIAPRPAIPTSYITAGTCSVYSGGNALQNLDGGDVPMDIALHVQNANNIVLVNTATKIEGTIVFNAVEGDIILGNNNLVFTKNGTYSTTNNQYDGYAVTNGTGVVTKEGLTNSAIFVYPVGQAENDYTPTTITNTATLRDISVQVKTYANSGSTEMNPALGMDRTWQITSTVAGIADICLTHNSVTNPAGPATDGSSFNNSAAYVTQQTSSAGVWTLGIPPSSGGSPVSTHCKNIYTIPVSSTDNTSYFTKSLTTTPLPVTLADFTIREAGCGKAILNWSITNDINFDHFEIERSQSGDLYAEIAKIKYYTNTTGYVFSDAGLQNGTYQYRLKMVDINGSYTYGKIVTLKITCEGGEEQISVYPNPVNNQLHIVASDMNSIKEIRLMDAAGKLLYINSTKKNGVDMSRYIPGVYMLQIIKINGEMQTEKIIKQ